MCKTVGLSETSHWPLLKSLFSRRRTTSPAVTWVASSDPAPSSWLHLCPHSTEVLLRTDPLFPRHRSEKKQMSEGEFQWKAEAYTVIFFLFKYLFINQAHWKVPTRFWFYLLWNVRTVEGDSYDVSECCVFYSLSRSYRSKPPFQVVTSTWSTWAPGPQDTNQSWGSPWPKPPSPSTWWR